MDTFMIIIVFVALVVICFSLTALFILYFKNRGTMAAFNAIYQTDSMFLLAWDTNFNINHMNRAFTYYVDILNSVDKKLVDKTIIYNIFGNGENFSSCNISHILENALTENGWKSYFVMKDGTYKQFVWNSKVVQKKGDLTKVLTIGLDVSNVSFIGVSQENSISAISDSTVKMLDNSGIYIVSIDLCDYRFSFNLSKKARKILGLPQNNNISLEDFSKRVHLSDYKVYNEKINKLISGTTEEFSIQLKLQLWDNKYHDFVLKLTNKPSEATSAIDIMGVLIDISKQYKESISAEKVAFYDYVTGLYNKYGFTAKSKEFIKNAKKGNLEMAVICVKICKYQKTSVLFGLETVEALLKLYAQTLSRLGEDKALLGKFGVDDFAILIQYKEKPEIEDFLRELKLVIQSSCNNVTLPEILKDQVGFNAGVALYNDCDDILTLYNKAGLTLFSTNDSQGGKIYYFSDSMEQLIYEKRLIEQELATAIAEGQFELYYQPKVSFKTGKIIGAEALMRWNHPLKGIVMPSEFIGLAEETGMITKLDNWGLSEACRQNKLWIDKGFTPMSVSVNMSQAQLYLTDVVGTIVSVLEKTKLPPEYLEVELTETMAIVDLDRAVSVLKKIKSLGVHISMDDFGTGFSSLSALKLLPIDVLKIDRSLIIDITENENARCVTKAIVDLGKAMKLLVLAEGVETDDQRSLLTLLGCDMAQGYFYGKPLTVADMERLFLIPTLTSG